MFPQRLVELRQRLAEHRQVLVGRLQVLAVFTHLKAGNRQDMAICGQDMGGIRQIMVLRPDALVLQPLNGLDDTLGVLVAGDGEREAHVALAVLPVAGSGHYQDTRLLD